jgi:cysteine synthase A
MSIERRRLMAAYGAELVLTPREQGMRGAISRARELAASTANSWIPQQFENQANVEVHRRTTAREILNDFPDGFDMLITGIGTGGHITGVGQMLRSRSLGLKIFGVEPSASPVLSGGAAGPHPIQGIGAGFVPAILDRSLLDGVIQITRDEAFECAQRCARVEGILVGISTGAALAAVTKKLPELRPGGRILTFCYDSGERYLSVEGLLPYPAS